MSEKFTSEIPIRFRDLDPLNHVNNAVYASYLEEVRSDYIEEVLGLDERDHAFVLAALEIDYERPITIDDDLTIALTVTDLGTTSCTMAYEFLVDGGIVASAETTLVRVDPETKRPEAIPDEICDRVREYEGLEAPAT
ncbi:acyl-CoA thioesterase [Halosolutus halophilus]|uniref:acyl-CoA thioesterase n=1 Tax=Halosolutus halophilus TaxID=1552990 RepID=UPI0022352431|nr:thioesterase family protein [Halosolutus halophilus]